MSRRVAFWGLIGLLAFCGTVSGQGPYGPPASPPPQAAAPAYPQAGEPSGPRWPPYPTFERRSDSPPPEQPPTPPFVLSPQEQAQLDQVLAAWEQRSAKVDSFEAKFTRWQYDGVFGADSTDQGEVKYAAPDKGVFQVIGEQPEHWICDGKSVFEYNFVKRQLIEYKLAPESQGQGITDSPLPFLFGTTAAQLSGRYFLRIVTPPNVQGQVWLEALPRYQADAQNFQRAEVILDTATMLPTAIQTHEPNGKTRTVYKFEKQKVNPTDPLRGLDPLNLFDRDPFKPSLPRGWTKVVEQPPPSQAAQSQANPRR